MAQANKLAGKSKRKKFPKDEEPEKTVLKSLAQCSFTENGEPSSVDVRNGRILRIRPFRYSEKITRDDLNLWQIEKNGRKLELLMKTTPAAYQLAYKKRVYSPNRIKYPLKRVDWDPNGERNPQNRGKSKYKRISWDEAADIIASEIRRIKEKYGPNAVLCHGDGHGETKTVHGPHGCQVMLMRKVGGYTLINRNPDSWEGWYWGAEHIWGSGNNGHMWPCNNVLKDVCENTEMLVHIGCDLETTPWGFNGQFPSRVCYFWTDIGIKQIFISPDLNYSAAIHADKWIPVLPNTDAALHLAIAYTWITEGTYDKDYVATHVVGFDKFEDYVLGKEDGVPKTPAWASPKCQVPEWTIKALARQWASQKTSTIHFYGGSYIRGPYSHEPARLEVCLLGMQGLGKPGVHQYNNIGKGWDLPRPSEEIFPVGISAQWEGWSGRFCMYQEYPVPQMLPKTQVHHAILNPPVSSWGSTAIMAPVENQFVRYAYPLRKEEGGTEVHMLWTDSPCLTACWNCGYEFVKSFRSPKIECLVAQHPWLENDCVFADIILPVSTKLEEEDIAHLNYAPLRGMSLENKAIEPIGESMSDYEAVGEVAKKLGLYDEYTGGRTIAESIKSAFTRSKMPDYISWEKFKEQSCHFSPTDPNWRDVPAGLINFYKDPEKHPLGTPTGKLEFYSGRLAKHFPEDKERPPVPNWIEKGETHDESLSSDRAKKYPLLLMSNHGRWRTHSQDDDITWLREIPTCKVRGSDGYMYEPVWLHPTEAAKRGIENGDIVKLYNERGAILAGAIVWERLIPGAAYIDHGARVDIISGEDDEHIDRGGSTCLIAPTKGISRNCWGMATSGYLVEAEKVTMAQMEEWRKQYPEAFEREYDPASGLRFNAWVEGGM